MPDRVEHDPPLDRRESYKTWASDKLRFADTDMLGHVNNAAFATFCETGRVMFLYDPERPIKPPDTDFVIVRLVLDFRRELHYPGLVEIGTRVLRIGGSSFLMGQGLFKDGECAATAEGTCVLIDRTTRRPVRLSDELRERLAAL
jgi:acyl-CoA thioester hydrolase